MRTLLDEVWKDVDGYQGHYQVSNLGRVRSLTRTIKGRWGLQIEQGQIMSPVERNGYLRVCLKKDGKGRNFPIHRLVAIAFIQNPNNLPEVNHINENKKDNRLCNLEWCDRKHNCKYGTRTERLSKKLSKEVLQLTMAGEVVAKFKSAKDVQRKLGYSSSYICECCNGKHKSLHGYKWRYA